MDTQKNGLGLEQERLGEIMKGLDGKAIDGMIEFLTAYKQANFPGNADGNTAGDAKLEGTSMETLAAKFLVDIGVPANIRGYKYLKTALVAVAQDQSLVETVTKSLYPLIAKEHRTTESRAERAIRHAVEIAWDRCPLDVMMTYFGNTISPTRGKPTNSEFIAKMSEHIREALNR